MITERASATVALLLTAEPDVADRDEVAAIVRRSREVRSWLDSIDVVCARRTRELAAAGAAEPAGSLLEDAGQRSTRDAVIIDKRVPACDAMPQFEAALAAGQISGSHVDAVAAVLARLDEQIRVAFIAEQDALLAAAQRQPVEAFTAGCRDLVRFLTAERDRATGADTEMEELARQRAASKIRQWINTDDGMHHTHIELDPVRGAKLSKALADLLRRHRKTDTNTGVPWDQLQVDSFLNGIDRAVTTRNSKQPSQTPDTSDHAGTHTTTDQKTDPPAGTSSSCGCDHQHNDWADTNGSAPTALPELRIPEIGVLIDMDSLIAGLHEHSICETYNGTPIPISEVRRLCCEADIIPYVLNGKGEVTDLGRSTRTVTRAQRRKLRAMHKTCVGDGCEVGFEHCEIHHVIFWRLDGRSDISNLVPVGLLPTPPPRPRRPMEAVRDTRPHHHLDQTRRNHPLHTRFPRSNTAAHRREAVRQCTCRSRPPDPRPESESRMSGDAWAATTVANMGRPYPAWAHVATVTPMANEAMKQNWAGGGERWAANERIINSVFTPVTEAIIEAADLAGATRLLDVGCGTGALLEASVAAGVDAVGVDISASMVAGAVRSVPEATVIEADAQTDDLLAHAPGVPFDRVVSRFGVMFFDDPVAAFANIRAACAPGAELAIACWRAEEHDGFMSGLAPLAARMKVPLAPPPVGEPGPLGLGTSELVGDTLALAGWANVVAVALDVPLDYSLDGSDGVEERLAMALSGLLGRKAAAELEPQLGPEGWNALLDESRAELRNLVVDGSVRFTGHIWLVTATNPNDIDDIDAI